MTKIAIIGTGLCGLSVAHFLKDRAKITLFEKALGVSGRMSTRRAGIYLFDHGVLYFTQLEEIFFKTLSFFVVSKDLFIFEICIILFVF